MRIFGWNVPLLGKDVDNERGPREGDAVWWAAKQMHGVVTEVKPDQSFVFIAGPVVRNKLRREVPRYTVAASWRTKKQIRRACEELAIPYDRALKKATRWDPSINAWVVGQGPVPKNVRGQVINPSPVSLTGDVRGSFATGDPR